MKRVYVNEEWKEKPICPRIHIEENDKICYAVSCRHCTNPICIKSCIAGAISKVDGVVHVDQNKCAGVNMAGGSHVFDKAIPMNSIGFFGLHAMTAGSYYTSDDSREHIPLNSIDFEILKKSASVTAFSQEKRKHIFGGVV